MQMEMELSAPIPIPLSFSASLYTAGGQDQQQTHSTRGDVLPSQHCSSIVTSKRSTNTYDMENACKFVTEVEDYFVELQPRMKAQSLYSLLLYSYLYT
jgi:hypothetical protein